MNVISLDFKRRLLRLTEKILHADKSDVSIRQSSFIIPRDVHTSVIT